MKADGRNVEFGVERALVQALDIAELMLNRQPAGVNFIVGLRMEHEGVVGIGAVGNGDGPGVWHFLS